MLHTYESIGNSSKKQNPPIRSSTGRSAGIFARGGIQQPFRTQLDLFQLHDGTTAKILSPGSIVQLGDELMLRAHVKAGDGRTTRYSKPTKFISFFFSKTLSSAFKDGNIAV